MDGPLLLAANFLPFPLGKPRTDAEVRRSRHSMVRGRDPEQTPRAEGVVIAWCAVGTLNRRRGQKEPS